MLRILVPTHLTDFTIKKLFFNQPFGSINVRMCFLLRLLKTKLKFLKNIFKRFMLTLKVNYSEHGNGKVSRDREVSK